MNLTALASIGLVLALVAIPQLVIYFATRGDENYVEPECDYDMR